LILAGPLGWLYDEELEIISKLSKKKIKHIGFVPRLHMVALLKCAKFFTFPSIYEGFGLPVLEAMSLGVPVLTSNNSSLGEISEGAAVLVNPLSVTEIAKGISLIDNDLDLRNSLSLKGKERVKKFSYESYYEKLTAAYNLV
jgi:glycosyltransferase involved in cell wall biosynthesis